MTGHLQIKNDKYYAVINTYKNGKRSQKWISTGYTTKGNKTKAEKFLRYVLTNYEDNESTNTCNFTFSEYVKIWLNKIIISVDSSTYEGYEKLAYTHIIPYFENTKTNLQDIGVEELQKYIDEKSKNGRLDNKGGLSAKSLRLHRNILNQTLKDALKNGYIKTNPCSLVKFPQITRREPNFYNCNEVDELLSCITDDIVFFTLVKIASTYGLRRSEVLGLKWNVIDFDNSVFKIAHTVVNINTTVRKDKTKNESSYRIFPLIDSIKELLINLKRLQIKNRKDFGNSYIESDYIFVWPNGKPYSTSYVSQHFQRILRWNNLPLIRFHDLRHSCASILLNKGFTLKDVQEWLGHSDITLTANIYGHLDIERKINIANSLK